jgi:serine/threonine protein kinase/nucleoside phosphorylase/Leucine-rich repeat (LRR) protein
VLNNRFEVKSRIGEGGFGTVYRGTQLATGRKVALKLLHPELTKDDNVVARFRREGLVLCNLRDAHTITTYDFDRTPDGTLFIAMELLEGKSLQQLFHEEAPLAWPRVFKILDEMCSSLAEAHAHGIVHRDLKPENILLETRAGNPEFVKIVDFGIAKVMRGETIAHGEVPELTATAQLTATGQTMGTLEYMSPEQLMGKQLDGRSDIYALGVLAYEMITGRLPFPDAKGPAGLITAQLKQTPLPPSRANPRAQLPDTAERVILRCLEKDKNHRFADVSQLSVVLQKVIADPTSAASLLDARVDPPAAQRPPAEPPPAPPTQPSPQPSKRKDPPGASLRIPLIMPGNAKRLATPAARPEPELLSPEELDAVLAQARGEGWRELAILGPRGIWLQPDASFKTHAFCLREPLGADISALASLTRLTALDLRANQTGDEGARALRVLTELTFLDLSGNQIADDGAKALAGLRRLTSLSLSTNRIGDEGACALAALTSLTSLDLSANHIGPDGARALAALTGLTRLAMGASQIASIGLLARGTPFFPLQLNANHLGDEGARSLAALGELTELDLSDNEIGDAGARAVAGLDKLIVLDLGDNEIGNEGAHALTRLTRLTSLSLRANRLGSEGAHALLEAWCDAPHAANLKMLDLRDNADIESVLPPEVLQSRDAQSILAAYRRYRDSRQHDALRPLNEAKLVVVGNEAVGKTSLVRYLVHDKPRHPDERKTPGAAIHEKIEVNDWSVHRSPVRLHVWDFGGQEIMRGTHRFFLTERSLYLLVLEDRREDDRSIYEWLEVIAQRGGDSPVIVVINKTDGEVPLLQLDEVALRRSYPAIVGFARTSCNADAAAARTIAALRAQIATILAESTRLKHVRDPVPETWLRVKDAITALARARSVLPVRDFERLCEGGSVREPERITDPDEQRALLALLHDLGLVIAHGLRDDAPAVRREITVLDPNWLTGAIYALINSPLVRDQGGELRHDQLGAVLDPTRYPARWHELILSIAQEPELGMCLRIPHGDPARYLLPDALPIKEPDYENVWPADALRFRFQYSLLPTGLIPRFIVEAHRSLTERSTWWRTGVVLGIEDCRILVRGDARRNRVEIQVTGNAGQRAALSVVRGYFDTVHHYYARLPVKARVPLPEQPEVDVGYEHLIALEQRRGLDHMFLPEDAAREYTVRELLEGVRDDRVARRAVASDRTRTGRTPDRIDFGILTIRHDENAAVLRRFDKLTTEERRRRYRLRSLALPGGGAYKLAVIRCLEQGNTDAQAAASALLEDLAPRFVLVVGTAGGVPSDEMSLGDVVVSSRIADFSVEALIRNQGREHALRGGPLHPDAARLAGDIAAMITDGELDGWASPDAIARPRPLIDLAEDRLYGDREWKSDVRRKLVRHVTSRPPRPLAITGAIASSDRLIKDDETMSIWLKIAREIMAVEMESAGIYKATQERGVPFLAIRGISDVVGLHRDPEWTAYACETAAAFTRAFLLTRPIPPIAQS